MMLSFRFFPRVIRKIDDESLWIASVPPHYSEYQAAIDSIRLGRPRFYFREIKKIWGPVWAETGRTWENANYEDFDLKRDD
jgi:hypothetical protein